MKKITSALLLTLTVILFAITLIGNHGLIRLHKIDSELQELANKNMKLMSKVLALENRIYGLKTSDDVLEKNAREHLGLSKPGEIVYIFHDAEQGGSSKLSQSVK